MNKTKLTQLLNRLDVGMNDWITSYAPEFCREEDVIATNKRLGEFGTLWYIAQLRYDISVAIELLEGGEDGQ